MIKRPDFLEGVVVALFISVTASILAFVLSSILGQALSQIVFSAISFAYVMYLLIRSKQKTGRIVITALWFGITISCLLFVESVLLFILIHLGLFWLVRSLYYYNSFISSMLDLGLTGLSLLATLWAWTNSGSLFLSLWALFLTQALFSNIPQSFTNKQRTRAALDTHCSEFNQACKQAEHAVRLLTSSK